MSEMDKRDIEFFEQVSEILGYPVDEQNRRAFAARAEAGKAFGDPVTLGERLVDMRERAEKAEAQNAKLKEALLPFARFGEILGPPSDEGFDILIYEPAGYPELKIAGNDCRRARAVLAECEGNGE